MKKWLILSFAVLAIFTESCTQRAEGTYYDQEIDAEVKARLTTQNDRIVHSIVNGNENELRSMMSEQLLETLDNDLSQFMENASQYLEQTKYTSVGNAHTIQSDTSQGIVISMDTMSVDAFEIRYKAITAESYASVLVPDRDGDRYVLTTLFGKFGDQWKLNAIQFGRLEVIGLTAPKHFEIAMGDFEAGLAIPALNRMAIASSCVRPGNAFWHYKLEPEMDDFTRTLLKKVNETYQMPYVLEDLPFQPQIFSIGPHRIGNEICSMVKYTSEINLEDTVALAAENKAIHALVPTLFEGIDYKTPFILYRAFSTFPEEDVASPYFGFVRKVENETRIAQ